MTDGVTPPRNTILLLLENQGKYSVKILEKVVCFSRIF